MLWKGVEPDRILTTASSLRLVLLEAGHVARPDPRPAWGGGLVLLHY